MSDSVRPHSYLAPKSDIKENPWNGFTSFELYQLKTRKAVQILGMFINSGHSTLEEEVGNCLKFARRLFSLTSPLELFVDLSQELPIGNNVEFCISLKRTAPDTEQWTSWAQESQMQNIYFWRQQHPWAWTMCPGFLWDSPEVRTEFWVFKHWLLTFGHRGAAD